MQRVISLKPIPSSFVSPHRQKCIRVERFSALNHDSLKLASHPPQHFNFLSEDENMLIHVFDNLRQWLVSKNLQGFIQVVEAEPHPRACRDPTTNRCIQNHQ